MVYLATSTLVIFGLFTQSLALLDWSEEHLAEKITIRLVKRDWKPYGPSAKTDEVMDEYRWDVPTAFMSMMKSSYQYVSAQLRRSEELFKDTQNYDSSLDTIVLIHPILSNADLGFTRVTIGALAMRNLHKKYNIFAVNMGELGYNVIESVLCHISGQPTKYEPMSEMVALFLLKGIDMGKLRPEQIHLVGQSYSGQLSGYIARYIGLLYDRKIASILSLDPYYNSLNNNMMHVSKEDAEVVHLYHTNSVMAGTRERIGHADFIFNDGNIQPECYGWKLLSSPLPDPMLCSHIKVIPRIWYVILYPSKFVARRCISWNRFNSCLCETNPTAFMKYPLGTDPEVSGTYYLRTTYKKPYGMGKPGSSCTPDMRTEFIKMKKMAESKARRRLA